MSTMANKNKHEGHHHKKKKRKPSSDSGKFHGSKRPKKTKTDTTSGAHKRPRKHADLVERCKVLWNQLRKKNNSKQQTRELMDQLMPLITGKCAEIALQHDASRVVQAAIQFGSPDERKAILKELCAPSQQQQSTSKTTESALIELCKSQYAHFVALKLIKYCGKDAACVALMTKSLRKDMAKLAVHAHASRVVESLFSNLSNKQLATLKQEFYGQYFALFAAEQQQKGLPTLASNLQAAPEKREQTIEFVRTLVSKGMEKQLYGYSYFQDLFVEYLDVAKGSEIRTIAASAADHSIHLLSTRAGARVVASLVSYGTAKDRKRIMKSLKGYCRTGLLHRDAYLAILRLVQVTDDTVSVQKSILQEILSSGDEEGTQSPLLELALSETASKLFLLLLPQSDETKNKYFDPFERKILSHVATISENGEDVPTSKKDPEVRRKELLRHLREPLVELCTKHPGDLLRSRSGALVLREVYSSIGTPAMVDAIVNVCVAAISDTGERNSKQNVLPLFEDRDGHLAVKNLILLDASARPDDQSSFSSTLCSRLKVSPDANGRLLEIAESNRGAFVVSALCKVPSVRDNVVLELKGEKKTLNRRANGDGATAGFTALLNEVTQTS